MPVELYTIKPLIWKPVETSMREALETADTPEFGKYEVFQSKLTYKWGWFAMGFGWSESDSLESAKSACEAHWRERLKACLDLYGEVIKEQ